MVSNTNALLKYAYYSRYAYFDEVTPKELEATLSIKARPLRKIDKNGAFCWVFDEEETDTTIVSFRGTDSLGDAIVNLQLFRSPFQDLGYVHKGYLNYYHTMRSEILDVLHRNAKNNIVFAGHSLGGVCGTISALDVNCNKDLLDLGNRKLSIYTYGAPALGDKTLCDNVEILLPDHHRVVNESDLAPMITSTANCHVKNGTVVVGSKLPMFSVNELARTMYCIHQHNIESYIFHLRRLQKRPSNMKSQAMVHRSYIRI